MQSEPEISRSEDPSLLCHKNINCKSCIKYNECRSIENKYKDKLQELDGNWRAIIENGRRVGTPIRRCSYAIVETHLNKFMDRSVLEIGCGPLSEIDYAFCRQNNVSYTGLDPERIPLYFIPHTKGKSLQNNIFTSLLKIFNVKKYPKRNLYQRYIMDNFPSHLLEQNSFDLIYSNSSIEHWHQEEEDIQASLNLYREDMNSCYDILRPGGMLLMNCPVYVHGNDIFVRGKINIIENFFSGKWKSVEFEHWRELHDDLMPYCPDKRKESFKETYSIDLVNIWLLNIVATK
ncbi:MAG: class I SAM-dependent methyltransferase [Candidatus Brocadiaceae bacterium]|nr:class I SAM-dependent methyltransferase [Candidatus Brocadiaceae bacterium]